MTRRNFYPESSARAALRNELHKRLSVTLREVSENAQGHVAEVPEELLTLWSKRTATIDSEAAPKIAEYERLLGRSLTGAQRARVVKTAVLKTRARKQHSELSALHATWTAEAAKVGWTPARLRRSTGLREGRVRQMDREVLPDRTDSPAASAAEQDERCRVAAAALHGAGTRRAVFSRADVAGQVAGRLPTGGLSAAEVVARVEQLADLAIELQETVPVGSMPKGVPVRESDARYATVQVLSAEARILELAASGRRCGYGLVPLPALMAAGRCGRLNPSQHRAVLRLAGGGDLLSVLTAPAVGWQDQHAWCCRPAAGRTPGSG